MIAATAETAAWIVMVGFSPMSLPTHNSPDTMNLISQELTIVSPNLFQSKVELRSGTHVLATLHVPFAPSRYRMWLEDASGARWRIVRGRGFFLWPGALVTDANSGQTIAEFDKYLTGLTFTGPGMTYLGTWTFRNSDLFTTQWTLANSAGDAFLVFQGSHPVAIAGCLPFIGFGLLIVFSLVFRPVNFTMFTLFCIVPGILSLIGFVFPRVIFPVQVKAAPAAASLPNLPLSILLAALALYGRAMPEYGYNF